MPFISPCRLPARWMAKRASCESSLYKLQTVLRRCGWLYPDVAGQKVRCRFVTLPARNLAYWTRPDSLHHHNSKTRNHHTKHPLKTRPNNPGSLTAHAPTWKEARQSSKRVVSFSAPPIKSLQAFSSVGKRTSNTVSFLRSFTFFYQPVCSWFYLFTHALFIFK